MSSGRILLTDGLQKAGKEILDLAASVDDRKGITSEELLSEINNYDAVIVRWWTKMTEVVIDQAKKLKLI